MNLPAHPYNASELKVFAQNRAEFLLEDGEPTPLHRKKFELSLMAKVSLLPPELQIILVERQGDVTVGPARSLGFQGGILGCFEFPSGDIQVRDLNFGLWGGSHHVFQHEVGHKTSFAAGQYEGEYFSADENWRWAVNRQRLAHAKLIPNDRFQLTTSLYHGAWDLLEHLSKKAYVEKDYPEECAAEMLKHYSVLCSIGTPHKAMLRLAEVYTALTESFSIGLLPAVKQRASCMYRSRMANVQSIAASFASVDEKLGVEYDADSLQMEASLSIMENYEKALLLSFHASILGSRMSRCHAFEDVFFSDQADALRKHFPSAPFNSAANFIRHVGRSKVLEHLHGVERGSLVQPLQDVAASSQSR